LGLIGSGMAMERIHLPTIKKLPEQFEIGGLCSSSPEKARRFASENRIDAIFDSTEELLSDSSIEAVVIAVPITENYDLARQALARGKHVLVEKPLATSINDARALVELSASKKCTAMVAENVLYWPVVEAVKGQLDAGVIGDVRLVQWNSFQHVAVASQQPWRSQPSHPGGYLLDSGIHFVAAFQFLFGNLSPLGGIAKAIYPELGTGDYLNVNFQGRNKMLCSLTLARTPFENSVNENRCTIIGTEGKILFSTHRYLVRALDSERDVEVQGDLGYTGEYKDFHHAIRTHEQPRSSFERAAADLELLLTAIGANLSS
jgi:predicted dehydrogenase